jgi:hypothetical protein
VETVGACCLFLIQVGLCDKRRVYPCMLLLAGGPDDLVMRHSLLQQL